MKLSAIALMAILFSAGCVRFGYDAQRRPREPKPDAPHTEAGTRPGTDGAVLDAGRPDASALDGSSSDADAADSGWADARPSDSGADATASPTDAAPMESDGSDGQTDGAVDSDSPGACPSGSAGLFCDGFEDPSFTNWSYPVIEHNGALSQSTTRFHSGAASLRATTGASGNTNAARYGKMVFGNQKSGEIWVRSYYYIPSSSVADPSFSTCVVAEIEQPYFGFALIVLPARVDIGVGSTFYAGTMAFPRDRWVCVELHVHIDSATGIFEAYLDGLRAVQSPATNTLPDMGYTSVDVGIHYTDTAQGPLDLWVDDVVAGTTRAGCN